MPIPSNVASSRADGHDLRRSRAMTVSASAASATRTPLNASGARTRVPYLTTVKFAPQMQATASIMRSVGPNRGRAVGPSSCAAAISRAVEVMTDKLAERGTRIDSRAPSRCAPFGHIFR
jgi:hypothetical protein